MSTICDLVDVRSCPTSHVVYSAEVYKTQVGSFSRLTKAELSWPFLDYIDLRKMKSSELRYSRIVNRKAKIQL